MFKFILLPALFMFFADYASASLPALGQTGSASEVRTASGASCTTGTQRTIVDAGVVSRSFDGIQQNINPVFGGFGGIPQESGLAYVRVTVPLGAKKGRLDCTRMYNLELDRMKNENALLKAQIEQLRNAAVVVNVD